MTALSMHYASMPIFEKIFISWANSTKPTLFLEHKHKYSALEHVHVLYTDDSLNARFEPPRGLTTACVFISDDDMFVSETTVLSMYRLWSSNNNQLVGLWPRGHEVDVKGQYRYTSRPLHSFSMVLTKFMVLNSRYLELYTNEALQNIRDYIDSVHNCEDIAMNYLVSATTQLPPLYVHDGRKVDFGGKSGIYTRTGHSESRNTCVSDISKMMGDIQLVTSFKSYSALNLEEKSFKEDTFKSIALESSEWESILRARQCSFASGRRVLECTSRMISGTLGVL